MTGWRALGLLALLGVAATARAESDVRGRVLLDLPGTQLADLGPVVVYLAAEEGVALPHPASQPSLHQKSARFSPPFLAIAAGQSVAMLNDDQIYHNVFSYSKPNDFDLGLYPAGESKHVLLEHPGVVKLYCSIHESMNGMIFVSPTAWFDVASPDGRFAIRGVPPGRHRLRTWNEKLPDTEQTILVPASGLVSVEIRLLESQ